MVHVETGREGPPKLRLGAILWPVAAVFAVLAAILGVLPQALEVEPSRGPDVPIGVYFVAAATTATGAIGLKVALTWALIGFIGGAALSIHEINAVRRTYENIKRDEELQQALKSFLGALVAEARARGFTV